MAGDLDHGFVGCLDELVPDLFAHDDIYGANRLTRDVRSKDVGAIAQDAAWEVQYLWWNSETQSNWWDGYLRTALLLDSATHIDKVRHYVARILSTQDADGYLGIYAPDLRYSLTGENGELWAQATLLRGLLGVYEATADSAILEAVGRAVSRTMRAFSPDGANPFDVPNPYAGLSHGLMFTDVLDGLEQLTGDASFGRYATWLYAMFSEAAVGEPDVQYDRLMDPSYRFQAHGVHTYEHLRPLATAAYAGGNPRLLEAVDAYLDKLAPCLAPSGGPIGDEWIAGRAADARTTGYEYCSIQELLDSLLHLASRSGRMGLIDRAEWLFFNAGHGARHPSEPSIAYLKTDDSFSMTGEGPSANHAPGTPQIRYKYSPVHQDAAVCCAPNAGRLYPTYVRAMWMRTAEGLLAALYGPCELHTTLDGIPVEIIEETSYPFELSVEFQIRAAAPVAFTLTLRRPAWAGGMAVDCPDAAIYSDGALVHIRKRWGMAERLSVRFEAAVESREHGEAGVFVTRGPLLYALPLDGAVKSGKEYGVPGFRDLFIDPAVEDGHRYLLQVDRLDVATYRHGPWDEARPWTTAEPLELGTLDRETGKTERLRLAPLGATVLRRVTFGLG